MQPTTEQNQSYNEVNHQSSSNSSESDQDEYENTCPRKQDSVMSDAEDSD